MRATGRIESASVGISSHKPKLMLELDNKAALMAEYDNLKDKVLSIEIKPYRKKRSLNANAYAWVLMDKIAESQGITKEEVYLNHIKEVGVFRVATISEDAVDTLMKGWSMNGVGWVAEKLGSSDVKGFVDVTLYYGSSVYNTKQMTRLIDNIVQDCNALGIETKTPDEIANMLSLWGENREKHTSG